MKIYTKTGDKGETLLFGGKRVPKNNLRINAYGTVDELNSFIGSAISEIKSLELISILKSIQNDLFTIGGNLASPIENEIKKITLPSVEDNFISRLENIIDKYESKLPELKNFILPGGIKSASALHIARSVCRRAEREVVTLNEKEIINAKIIVYLNRLSDLLFVLARFENLQNGSSEQIWQK